MDGTRYPGRKSGDLSGSSKSGFTKPREAELSGPAGTHDKRQELEEPYDGKLSRTVLKPSGGGDPVA